MSLVDQLPNPLLSGFHPDPSIVRVGDDFYLATSTFEYLPGIPVFHSTDLVSWELIGHVVTREGQLDSWDIPTAGGAWAPTIRHRDGVFHVVVTDAMGRGTLHFTATDPRGPWSDGTVLEGVDGIDPDLAWDADGTAYITYSALGLTADTLGVHRGIEQVRVDLAAGRATEPARAMWSGTGLQFPEAPHLYEHDGWWYLLIAEGGTERGHGISIARSASPMGPFEGAPHNPLVSARSTSRPIQNTGHGDLVQGPDGEWYVVLLGVRPRSMTRAFSALGRETFITPARWVDGWLEIDPVQLAPRTETFGFSDDFRQPSLRPEWLGIRRFAETFTTLDQNRGLVLTADGSQLDDPRPVFIGYRQQHLACTTSIVLDVSAGVGGLLLRYDERFHYEVEAGDGRVTARATVGGLQQEWTAPFDGGTIELRIQSRRPADTGLPSTSDVVVLSAVIDGTEHTLAEVDGRFLSSETTESFTGRVLGPYALRGTVVVDRFDYTGSEEAA